MKNIRTFPEGETFVVMTKFKGEIIVCSTCGVYRIVEDKLIPIELELCKDSS